MSRKLQKVAESTHFGFFELCIFHKYVKSFIKVQSCKLHNNKYIIALTQLMNTNIFFFIAVLVFKLLSRKVLFTNKKDKKNFKN